MLIKIKPLIVLCRTQRSIFQSQIILRVGNWIDLPTNQLTISSLFQKRASVCCVETFLIEILVLLIDVSMLRRRKWMILLHQIGVNSHCVTLNKPSTETWCDMPHAEESS